MKGEDLKKGDILKLKENGVIYILLEDGKIDTQFFDSDSICADSFVIKKKIFPIFMEHVFFENKNDNVEKFWEILHAKR